MSAKRVSRRGFIRSSMLLGGGGLASTAGLGAHDPVAPAGGRGPVLDVRDFGAVGDGLTSATRAIQHALNAAQRLGGGIVQLPAGTWRAGTLHFRSHVTLDLGPGAVL